MVLKNLEKDVLEYCRFPIPRTGSEVVDFLKREHPRFYPRTRTARVVALLKQGVLQKLIDENQLIEYSPKEESWDVARGFLKAYYLREGKALPRKIRALYQTNFLPAVALAAAVPKALNLQIATTIYPRLKMRGEAPNQWEILNLFYAYTENRDRLRLDLYKMDFTEKEREDIGRLLESSYQLGPFFAQFPFMSHIGKARQFLTRL